jgi:hypothetical protein
MTPKRLTERAPDDQDERVALYPDLPFEDAVAALLAVDSRKAGTKDTESPDGDA